MKEPQKDCSKCIAKKRGIHVLPHSHRKINRRSMFLKEAERAGFSKKQSEFLVKVCFDI